MQAHVDPEAGAEVEDGDAQRSALADLQAASDLAHPLVEARVMLEQAGEAGPAGFRFVGAGGLPLGIRLADQGQPAVREIGEHTSELQSRQYLVCRLLLDK